MPEQWIVYAMLSAVFAALVAIFGKAGLKDIDSNLATALRAFVMFVFILIVVLLQKKIPLISEISPKSYVFIVLAGIAGAISWIFYFLALKQGDATRVASLDRTSLVFVMIFSLLFLGEKFSWKTLLGVIAMVTGAILVII